MNIFKQKKSDTKEQQPEKNKNVSDAKQTPDKKLNPHAQGGCCGSCGGQGHK